MSKFYISHFVADFETQATRSALSVFVYLTLWKAKQNWSVWIFWKSVSRVTSKMYRIECRIKRFLSSFENELPLGKTQTYFIQTLCLIKTKSFHLIYVRKEAPIILPLWFSFYLSWENDHLFDWFGFCNRVRI